MSIISKLLKGSENKVEFKRKLKEAEEELKINKLLEERQKSSNRRELERYSREQEEEYIKNQLSKIHKKENSEMWKSKNSILKQKGNILKNDKPILKSKNIFKDDHKNDIPFMKKGDMFFKW
jgi:hypothetical protein